MFINIFNVLEWFLNIIMQFTDQLRCFRNLLVGIFCDIVFFDILGFSNYFGSLFHQPVCLHQSFALYLDIKRILVRFKSVDLLKWPNPGIRIFGPNFCFILKSKLFIKMYFQPQKLWC